MVDVQSYLIRDHEERIAKLEESQVEIRETLRDIRQTLLWARRFGAGTLVILGPTVLAAVLKFLGS